MRPVHCILHSPYPAVLVVIWTICSNHFNQYNVLTYDVQYVVPSLTLPAIVIEEQMLFTCTWSSRVTSITRNDSIWLLSSEGSLFINRDYMTYLNMLQYDIIWYDVLWKINIKHNIMWLDIQTDRKWHGLIRIDEMQGSNLILLNSRERWRSWHGFRLIFGWMTAPAPIAYRTPTAGTV